MQWALTNDERAFCGEVRAFLALALTPALREAGRRCSGIFSDYDEGNAWHRALAAQGWSVPHWPVEHGGTGWTPMQHYLFARELAAADAPARAPMGTHMVAPVIIAFGTEAQKQAWLPGIRSGEDYWCQGYSEPQSGSDLASLQCRAVRDGDHYVLNGTKIWTTHAQYANRMFCLVRTDSSGKPQQGISFLCFDMHTPGITVRPIISISGDHELNQVFFDDVRVPVSGRIGEENQGWAVAKYLLQHERGNAWSPMLRSRLRRVRAHAAAQQDEARSGRPDDGMAARLAEIAAAVDALEAAELKALRAQSRGEPPGMAPSLGKIAGSELRQRLTELHLEIAGPYGAVALPLDACDHDTLPVPEDAVFAMSAYLNDRAASIYAGTNEIQRNIVAGQLLANAPPVSGWGTDDESLSPLCDSIERYLRDRAPVPRAAALEGQQPEQTPDWWPGLVRDIGVLVAGLPEVDGGLGGGISTHMALMRALGAALAGEPYLSHAVLGMGVLQRNPGPHAAAVLQAAAQGDALLAWAHTEPGHADARSSPDTRFESDGQTWRLHGRKSVVVSGAWATHFIVSARAAGGESLVLVPADAPGLRRRAVRLRDGTQAAELMLDGVLCPAEAWLGEPGAAAAQIERALDEATLAMGAEAIRVLERLRDDTLDYVRQRKQFGAPIASFQAVQHRLVDMHLALEHAAALVASVQRAPLHAPAQLARAASTVKVAVAHACRVVGQGAVQLHGGMGMTEELAIGHFFRRATLIEHQFGSPAWHLRRLARLDAETSDDASGEAIKGIH